MFSGEVSLSGRLFCKEKKRDEYYEVDLPSLLDTNNIEEFKYFFYFFRRDAFLSPPGNFLDIVLKGSADHAKAKYNEGRKQKKTFEGFDEFNRARKGELYLATDKGERKASGSYYTPDYIVNYIVKSTLDRWSMRSGRVRQRTIRALLTPPFL